MQKNYLGGWRSLKGSDEMVQRWATLCHQDFGRTDPSSDFVVAVTSTDDVREKGGGGLYIYMSKRALVLLDGVCGSTLRLSPAPSTLPCDLQLIVDG